MTQPHLDEELLAAYFEGLLDPPAEAALRRRLARDPQAAELVAALGLILEAEPEEAALGPAPRAVTRAALDLWPAEPGPLRQGLRLAARWIGAALEPLADALQPLAQPAVSLRGAAARSDEGIGDARLTWHVELGALPVALTVTVEGPAQLSLAVSPLSPPPAGALLRLSAGDQLCAMSSLGPEGATVPALPAGAYTLSLETGSGPAAELEIDLSNPA